MVGVAAGFWRRFFAAFIDAILLGIVAAVLRGLHVPGFGRQSGATVWVAGGSDLSLLLSLVYFTAFHGSTGRTPGNAVLGIRVVDLRDGVPRPIGYPRAALRWLVSLASALVVLVGYVWMLFDGKRQTWHDKAAGSLPIYERALPPPSPTATPDDWADRLVG